MLMNKKEIVPNVFLVDFESQLELTSTFLRFQEYYESPEFKGRIFTLEEFKKWYIEKKGKFSYYTDWNGFNIPSGILTTFREGSFDPLSTLETSFLGIFEDVEEPFYVIGTHKEYPKEKIENLIQHETAHGLFYTNSDYKNEVLQILEKYNHAELFLWLEFLGGYHPDVFLDEAHAYGLSPSKKGPTIDPGLTRELKEIFNRYVTQK